MQSCLKEESVQCVHIAMCIGTHWAFYKNSCTKLLKAMCIRYLIPHKLQKLRTKYNNYFCRYFWLCSNYFWDYFKNNSLSTHKKGKKPLQLHMIFHLPIGRYFIFLHNTYFISHCFILKEKKTGHKIIRHIFTGYKNLVYSAWRGGGFRITLLWPSRT